MTQETSKFIRQNRNLPETAFYCIETLIENLENVIFDYSDCLGLFLFYAFF